MARLFLKSDEWARVDPAIRYSVYGAAAVLGAALLVTLLGRDEGDSEELLVLQAPGWLRSRPVVLSLHASIQPLAEKLLSKAWQEGISLVVTDGYRSLEEQERLYAQGRTSPGPIVTNARPGSSWHNYALAFDVAVLDASGKPSWPQDAALWQRIGSLGKSVGLSWGGEFSSIRDLPHFEFHPGLTLADAQAGARPMAYV